MKSYISCSSILKDFHPTTGEPQVNDEPLDNGLWSAAKMSAPHLCHPDYIPALEARKVIYSNRAEAIPPLGHHFSPR